MAAQIRVPDGTIERLAFESFVGLLYAAGIHIVLSESINYQHASIGSVLCLLGIVLYIFSDWLSRFRLPRVACAPFESDLKGLLGKTILEIVCLVFLVLATAKLANLEPRAALPYFITFLAATFVWNAIMFNALAELHWVPLLKALFRGTVQNENGLKHYAPAFSKYYETLVSEVMAGLGKDSTPDKQPTAGILPQEPSACIDAGVCGILFMTWQAGVDTGIQIIAFHLALADGIAAIILGVDMACARQHWAHWFQAVQHQPTLYATIPLAFEVFLFGSIGANLLRVHYGRRRLHYSLEVLVLLDSIIIIFCPPPFIWPLYLLTPFLLPLPLFYIAPDNKRPVLRIVASNLTMLILVILYIFLPGYILLIAFAGQQVVVNAFLQMVTEPTPGAEGQTVSC